MQLKPVLRYQYTEISYKLCMQSTLIYLQTYSQAKYMHTSTRSTLLKNPYEKGFTEVALTFYKYFLKKFLAKLKL